MTLCSERQFRRPPARYDGRCSVEYWLSRIMKLSDAPSAALLKIGRIHCSRGRKRGQGHFSYIDENIDVVLSDLQMGDVSGIDLLQLWKKCRPETQFILVTGHSSVNSAVEAIKAGRIRLRDETDQCRRVDAADSASFGHTAERQGN